MASKNQEEVCVTITWTIQNFGLMKNNEYKEGLLYSPYWKVEHTEGRASWKALTTWRWNSLIFFGPVGDLALYRCEMYIVLSSGKEVPLRGGDTLFFIEQAEIIGDKTQSILPTDTLTLCCRMWEETVSAREYHYYTVLRRVDCEWNLDTSRTWARFHTIEKDDMLFDIILEKEMGKNNDSINNWFLIVGLMHNADCLHSFVTCKISVKAAIIRCSHYDYYYYNSMRAIIKKSFKYSDTNEKSIDVQLESTIAIHEGSKYKFVQHPLSKLVKHAKSSEVSVISDFTLREDLLHLYRDALQSDATLMTEGKSFPVHRSILTARSPVFLAMFEQRQSSECQSGVVRIDDVDSQTLDRMLVYIYGGIVEELPWNEASALYYAADKYDVRTLKQKCVDMLKAGLATDNACDTLLLADKHLDQELMNCVVVFVRDHQEVFSSSEWEKLEEDNPRLTTKVLREVYVKNK